MGRIMALILVSAAAVVQAGEWQYDRSQDKMGRAEIKTARLASANVIEFRPPYAGHQRAWLHIRQHPRFGRDVILSLDRAQFVCGVVDGCTVLVRFDDSAAQRFSASEPEDHSSNLLFIEGYARFVTAMAKAKRVRIAATFYQEGSRIIEFDVAGFDWPDLMPKPRAPEKEPEVPAAKRAACAARADEHQLAGPQRDVFIAACEGHG